MLNSRAPGHSLLVEIHAQHDRPYGMRPYIQMERCPPGLKEEKSKASHTIFNALRGKTNWYDQQGHIYVLCYPGVMSELRVKPGEVIFISEIPSKQASVRVTGR